jgi:hypothetical protein
MLDAARDEYVVKVGPDRRRRPVDRLLAGATHPIELDARNALTPSGDHRRDPADVQPLLADWGHTAIDDVLDQFGIDSDSVFERAERFGREILGMCIPEGPVVLAKGRPYCVDDDSIVHDRWVSDEAL